MKIKQSENKLSKTEVEFHTIMQKKLSATDFNDFGVDESSKSMVHQVLSLGNELKAKPTSLMLGGELKLETEKYPQQNIELMIRQEHPIGMDVKVNVPRSIDNRYYGDEKRNFMFIEQGKTIEDVICLANFTFEVAYITTNYNESSFFGKSIEEERIYVLRIYPGYDTGHMGDEYIINIQDTDKGLKEILKAFPFLYINPSAKNVEQHFKCAFAESCKRAKCYVSMNFTGWTLWGNEAIYVHGGGAISGSMEAIPNIICSSDKKIEYSRNISAQEAGMKYLKSYELATLDKIVPLNAYVIASVLYTAFKVSGHPLNFVGYLCARTNSRKTSVCKVISSVVNASQQIVAANPRDSITALELKQWEYKDLCLLFDDIFPSESSEENRDMKKKLSQVYRSMGDCNSKSRSNVSLKKQKEYPPRGGVLITGEILVGNRSDLARTWIVQADEYTFDLNVLTELQHSLPELSTNWFYFIQYCARNFVKIVSKIEENFFTLRKTYNAEYQYGRNVDNLIVLQTAMEIMCNYLNSIGITSGTEFLDKCVEALKYGVKQSEKTMETEHPGKVYLNTLHGLMISGTVKLYAYGEAEGIDDKTKMGWQDEDYFYLLSDQAYSKARARLKSLGKMMPLDEKKINSCLKELGVLDCKETDINTTRIKLANGRIIRVLKIDKNKFYEIVVED